MASPEDAGAVSSTADAGSGDALAGTAGASTADAGSGDTLAGAAGAGGFTSSESDVAEPVAGAALASSSTSSPFHASTAAMPPTTSATSTRATITGTRDRGASSAVSAVRSGVAWLVPFDGSACDAPVCTAGFGKVFDSASRGLEPGSTASVSDTAFEPPSIAALSAARMSRAVWKRSSLAFASARMQTASRPT